MRIQQWIVVLFCFLITTCASATSKANNWSGASTKDVFKKLGYPTHVARLHEGVSLLIYKRESATCSAVFKVNREQKVVSIR